MLSRFKLSSRRTTLLAFLFLLIGLYFIYGQQFALDLQTDYDDPQVIETMRAVKSLPDYLRVFNTTGILDMQPVRDFVTWIDFRVLDWTGQSLFHLTNVLIWIATLLGLRKVFAPFFRGKILLMHSLLFLIAFNPLYANSNAWLSARKHTLAACFIVWTSVYFFKTLRQRGRASSIFLFNLFYALAVFSQPIVVLWPGWAGIYLLARGRQRNWKLLIFPSLVMIACLLINYFYYQSHAYLEANGGVPKFSADYNQYWLIRFFAYGRYFFQILCPYWTTGANYDLSSWRGLTGLLLIPAGIYLAWKLTSRKFVLLVSSFFILMLAPVTFKMTQIFGIDTYVITASFAIYLLIGLCLFKIEARMRLRNGMATVAFVIACAFIPLSAERVSAWDSMLNVFDFAYHLEGGHGAAEGYIDMLTTAHRFDEAVQVAEQDHFQIPSGLLAQGILAYSISTNTNLTTQQKIDEIWKHRLFSAVGIRVLSKLEMELKDYAKAEKLLLQILVSPDRFRVIIPENGSFAADLYVACKRASHIDCVKKAAAIKIEVGKRSWRGDTFEQTLRNQGMLKEFLNEEERK